MSSESSLIAISEVERPIPGRYIITLKDDADFGPHVSSVQTSIEPTPSNITHQYSIINGYAGDFTEAELNDLRAHPEIATIEQDGISYTCFETQTDATWGLGRISSAEKLTGSDTALDYKYKYENATGNGATVYIIDTGILTTHPAFEGRASWGKTFGGYEDKDGNGHGTHCAGTAVSKPYGVSKSSKVVAVKVLSDKGRGNNSDIISGVNWVAEEAARTGEPSVASMSLGGGASFAIDKAVRALINSGVTTVVAAGNDNKDATNFSPARITEAITVAAATIQDSKATFSNFGAPVDIWAPGLNITSTWNDGATKTISGTSMATPHVAGFAAYLLSHDRTLTPTQIAEVINGKALNDVVGGVPSGTVNKLLNNGL